MKCFFGDDGIKQMWNNQFHKLYNEYPVIGVEPDDTFFLRDSLYYPRIMESEIKLFKKNENKMVDRT